MTTKVQSSTINTVANTQITGLITASQIDSVSNTQITGTITSSQISSIPGNSPTTFTASQTFNGTNTSEAIKVKNGAESANLISGAPTSTANVYVADGAVQYYTSNTTTNWTTNITWSSSTTMASAMSVGDSITVAMLTTQGSTAHYCSVVTVDGNSVSPNWQGGVAPTSGNASGVDVYTFTIIKTAATPTYTVLAAQTQY